MVTCSKKNVRGYLFEEIGISEYMYNYGNLAELQIRGVTEYNSKIIFHISQ